MKKFIHISLCVALLGIFTVRADNAKGFFKKGAECTHDAAVTAGFTTAALLVGTEAGREAIKNNIFTDQNNEVNYNAVKSLGSGVAVGLAEYYELHEHLRNIPWAGDTLADFVDNHKVGVATATAFIVSFVLNSLKETAE